LFAPDREKNQLWLATYRDISRIVFAVSTGKMKLALNSLLGGVAALGERMIQVYDAPLGALTPQTCATFAPAAS
jgi:hypothetical protein